MELEPISDLKTAFGFSHRAGWCPSEKARFASPAVGSFRDVQRPLDRGWDPIYSRGGGAGSTYEYIANQKICRWGWDFHTVRGAINPGDIRVRPRVVGVVDVWMDFDPGM